MSAKPPSEFDALRQLLLKPELEALEQLRDPEERVQDLAEVLPGALVRLKKDKSFQQAMYPVLEDSVATLVNRNPKLLVDTMFPVLLPAMRRAVETTLGSVVRSFNQSLEYALSPRGIKWRIEALLTRKPFAEVVLSHTLLYRVEQAFLIHRETGLVMQHVATEASAQDASMVSAMLTAIGDFVSDAFSASSGALDTIDFGERKLLIEPSPKVVMALVVRGQPAVHLKDHMQDILSNLQTNFYSQIAGYNGNNQAFDALRPELKRLLEVGVRPPKKGGVQWSWFFWAGLVLLVGWLGWHNYQAHRAWDDYVQILRGTPGIQVTEIPRRNWVRGLRDPLAPNPAEIARKQGLRVKTEFKPYQSLEPSIVVKRIQNQLNTPADTRLIWIGQTLIVSGTINPSWLSRLRNLAPLLGVQRVEVLR
jgi:hypothetical protein